MVGEVVVPVKARSLLCLILTISVSQLVSNNVAVVVGNVLLHR
jgi:hypothetical protein